MPVDIETLQGLPLFNGLSTIELEELSTQLETQEFESGSVLIREGDRPDHPLFVLLQGSADVLKRALDERNHVISNLAAPSVFGEIEILRRRPAIATVVTASKVELAALHRGVFDEMCASGRPAVLKLVRNIAETLSHRLAATDARLAAHFDLGTAVGRDCVAEVRKVMYVGDTD